ncbi:MAG: hypothetical protein K0U98_09025 [Deltaproteobacteria bacterium]|nr:hypothetical protein [Deltaproteobacteria bacterium]
MNRWILICISALICIAPQLAAEPARLVRDIAPETEPSSRFPSWLRVAGDQFFFSIRGPRRDTVLWRTNGSPEGTVPVHHFPFDSSLFSPPGSTVFGDQLTFEVRGESDRERWISDGTASGTNSLEACLGPCKSDSSNPVQVGDRLVFTARTPTEGTELWTSDGSPGGTKLLMELLPGPEDGANQFGLVLSPLADQAVFLARTNLDRQYATELWITDGTEQGTQRVFDPGEGSASLIESTLPGKAFFFFRPLGGAQQLWVTDGTTTASRSLVDFSSTPDVSGPDGPLGEGDMVFLYSRFDIATQRSQEELWRTDGTEEGTGMIAALADLYQGDGNPSFGFGQRPFLFAGQAFFAFNDGVSGRELWATAGSAETTRLLADLEPGSGSSHPSSFNLIGGNLVFKTNNFSGHTARLWSTDGSSQGTQSLLAAEPFGFIGDLQLAGDRVVFLFNATGQYEIWQTDGTQQGTRSLLELPKAGTSSEPYLLIRHQESLAFIAPGEDRRADLWYSDGSETGTTPGHLPNRVFGGFYQAINTLGRLFLVGPNSLVESRGPDLSPRLLFDADTEDFAIRGHQIFFSHDDRDVGREPWVFDLDTGSSKHLYNVNPGFELDDHDIRVPKPSWPDQFTTFRNRVFFVADSSDLGRELWVSNGTRAGTRPIETVPGPESDIFYPYSLFSTEDQLFLLSADRYPGKAGLWIFREQSESLQNVFQPREHFDLTREAAGFRGRFFFVETPSFTFNGPAASEPATLWSTDGTPEGTREILVGTVPKAAPRLFTAAGMTLYFAAMTPETGWELWATDGTRAGTRLVRDINPGPESSLPRDFRAVKGKLMFSANDGVNGHEVWVSDGTEEGTQLISEIGPGAMASFPAEFTPLGEEILFSANRPDVGRELFALSAEELAQTCQPSDRRLCLQNGRIGVEVDWQNQRNGESGVGHALNFSDDTGTFWFFDAANVELVVKALDGRLKNESFWFFSGGLSDVKYWVTATDYETGRTLTFDNPAGSICGQADIDSLADSELLPTDVSTFNFHPYLSRRPPLSNTSPPGEACPAAPGALFLQEGRFSVEVEWQTSRSGGRSGTGTAIPATDKSGYFWFFQPENLELVVKVLDGRSSNGKFWFLWGALSDVAYQLKVTDTTTCQVRTYSNPEGQICGGADTQAF